MSNIDKEWLKQKIADMEAARDEIPFGLDEDDSNTLAALRIALASLEAEAVCVIDQSNLDYLKSGSDADVWPASRTEMGDVILYRSAPPAQVSVPDEMTMQKALSAIDRLSWQECTRDAYMLGWNACRAAMLQGAVPVTTKDDGGRYEQDDSPECGWVVTHTGKDYFYREQKDAVTHMNSAVESGLGVSLRSFIPEPVTTAYKLPANTPCKEAPEHIWLQTGGVWPENGEFSELTWCSDNQHKDDTLYVRADVVSGNSPVVPGGQALVPVEPTLEMIKAGANAASSGMLIPGMYRAMLAAAPQQEA